VLELVRNAPSKLPTTTLTRSAGNNMPKLTFVECNGSSQTIEATVGLSTMKAAVDHDVAGIVADCCGAMTCATCHVYVDDAWQSRVGVPADMEATMLECVVDPQPNSRLSCQITFTDELDGLVLHVPKRQF